MRVRITRHVGGDKPDSFCINGKRCSERAYNDARDMATHQGCMLTVKSKKVKDRFIHHSDVVTRSDVRKYERSN